MKSNRHISLEERGKISVLQSSGESMCSIARILRRSPSTISRELNKTQADSVVYCACKGKTKACLSIVIIRKR